jgi:hypothetical protein
MECPVCYKVIHKSAANTVVLKCSHAFCDKCACDWIIHKKTCPICRTPSDHFDRHTRSKERADKILTDVQDIWSDCVSIFGGDIPLLMFIAILDKYFIGKENRGLWNRPQMSRMKDMFKDICYLLDETHIVMMTPHQIDIVTKFMYDI